MLVNIALNNKLGINITIFDTDYCILKIDILPIIKGNNIYFTIQEIKIFLFKFLEFSDNK